MMRAALGVIAGCAVWTVLWLGGNSIFPLWYHLTFLILIVPITTFGGRLAPS